MSRNPKRSLCLINRRLLTSAAALLVTLVAGQAAHADLVIAPISAVITGDQGFGDIADTFNQTGLLSGYTSGVTDFDAYIATNPMHDTDSAGEWFSQEDPMGPVTVTYNLGSAFTINRLALWNEEGSGIATLNLFSSTNGSDFDPLATGLTPMNNPLDQPYPAQVFSFTATSAQFIRFVMTGPQIPFDFDAVGIGEVAFSQVQANGVPEPSSLAMLAIAAGGFGIGAYRRRNRRNGSDDVAIS